MANYYSLPIPSIPSSSSSSTSSSFPAQVHVHVQQHEAAHVLSGLSNSLPPLPQTSTSSHHLNNHQLILNHNHNHNHSQMNGNGKRARRESTIYSPTHSQSSSDDDDDPDDDSTEHLLLSQHLQNGSILDPLLDLPHPHTPSQLQPLLPTAVTAEDEHEPLYVNAKQYHRILKRRLARGRLEEMGRLSRQRKPYLHESRHNHAMRRPRGPGGRFLTFEEKAILDSGGRIEGVDGWTGKTYWGDVGVGGGGGV